MMNIGELARRTGLSVSAIRFYGDRRLLEPADVDPSSGYRSFSVDQIDRARMIADLRRMNMPLAEIERALDSSDLERRAVVRDHVERLETAVDRAHSIAQSLGAQPTRQETTMTNTSTSNGDNTKLAMLEARSLGLAIDQVLPAAGTSGAMPHLMCVLIESKDGSVRFAATDSHRLSIRDVVPSGTPAAFRAVVAAASIGDWSAALHEGSDVTLEGDDRTMTVSGDDVSLSAPIVPVTFPDYEAILIPARDRDLTSVLVDRDDLLTAFDRFDHSGAVLLSTSSGTLTLQRRDVRVEIAASGDGAEAHVAVDPAFAVDAVRAAVGVEAVIEIDDALSPVVFRSADDGTYTTLLMPVKLD